MRKTTALFLLALLLPLRAVEWRDNVYACSANLPESAGWAPIQVPRMAMMNAAIIVFEWPGSSPCSAPSKMAVGMKSHRLVVPLCRARTKSGMGMDSYLR